MQKSSKETTDKISTTQKASDQVKISPEQSSNKKEAATDFAFDWSPSASPVPKRKQEQAEPGKNVCDDFEEMGLSDALLRGVFAYGYEKPSVIQQRAIVPCMQGRDVVAQAQSGTGKTATFSIAMLQQLDMKSQHCQVSIFPCSYIHDNYTAVCMHAGFNFVAYKRTGTSNPNCCPGTW